MNIIAFGVPALFYLLVLCLCGYLLVRGVTHAFVALFGVGALIHLLQTASYVVMSRLPGGLGAHAQYLPWVGLIGAVGTLLFAAAFITLTIFLLPRAE